MSDTLFSQVDFLARFFCRSLAEGDGNRRQYRRRFEISRVEVARLLSGRVVVDSYQPFRDPEMQGVMVSPGEVEGLLEAIKLLMEFFPSNYGWDIPANPEPYLEFVSAIRDFEHPTYDVEDRLEAGTLVLSDDAMRVARAAGCVIDIERLRAQARVPLPGSEERQATDALVAELNLTPS